MRKNARKRNKPMRPTRAIVQDRISITITKLLSGERPIEIFQFASENCGITTERQVSNYIKRATEWIRASASKSREEQIIEHIGKMDFVYRAAEASGDHHAAIKAAQDKAKLLGLYPTEKMRLDVYDWRDEARKAGINPDEVLDEFERIVSAKMEAGHDGGGDSEGEGASSMDASPITDTASG